MTWVVIWALFGVASAIAASNKGRSGFAWFWLGVIFGPFGLLFALLIKSPDTATPVASQSPERARTCPYCAETVKAAAVVCRYCGKDLPPDPAAVQAATDDAAFEAWLATQAPAAGKLSTYERASYRQAWEYNRKANAG